MFLVKKLSVDQTLDRSLDRAVGSWLVWDPCPGWSRSRSGFVQVQVWVGPGPGLGWSGSGLVRVRVGPGPGWSRSTRIIDPTQFLRRWRKLRSYDGSYNFPRKSTRNFWVQKPNFPRNVCATSRATFAQLLRNFPRNFRATSRATPRATSRATSESCA